MSDLKTVVLPEPVDAEKETQAVMQLVADYTRKAVLESSGNYPEITLAQMNEAWSAIFGKVRALLAQAATAAAPVKLPQIVTEEMHAAAVKVLHRANGIDGLPQRMLDAMLAVAPAPADELATATGLPAQAVEPHPDDVAVDALSTLMKAKLAKQRAKGYGGWDTDCTKQRLSELLRGHVEKGDPVDVANFCAFLSARGEGIAPQAQADARDGDDAALIEWLSGRYISTDYHWGDPKTTVLVIEIPQNTSVCGDFRTDVREAMAIAAAKGE